MRHNYRCRLRNTQRRAPKIWRRTSSESFFEQNFVDNSPGELMGVCAADARTLSDRVLHKKSLCSGRSHTAPATTLGSSAGESRSVPIFSTRMTSFEKITLSCNGTMSCRGLVPTAQRRQPRRCKTALAWDARENNVVLKAPQASPRSAYFLRQADSRGIRRDANRHPANSYLYRASVSRLGHARQTDRRSNLRVWKTA